MAISEPDPGDGGLDGVGTRGSPVAAAPTAGVLAPKGMPPPGVAAGLPNGLLAPAGANAMVAGFTGHAAAALAAARTAGHDTRRGNEEECEWNTEPTSKVCIPTQLPGQVYGETARQRCGLQLRADIG